MKTLGLFAALFLSMASGQTMLRTVTLTWTASTSAGVQGYNVYRAPGKSSAQTGSYTKIKTVVGLTADDTTIIAGGDYNYVVTALASGAESAYSLPADVFMPNPPAPPTGLKATSINISVIVQ